MRREVEIKRGLSPIAKGMKIKSCLTPFIRHIGITFLTIFLLPACASQTDEERIAAINKRIAPEGYITKTHLYINWPALKQDEEVVAEPLKLKIPLEYLVPGLTFAPQALTEYAEESLFINDHKIISVSLTLLPKAQPYTPLLPAKNLPPKEAKLRSEYFKSAYAVFIKRDNRYLPFQIHSEIFSSAESWPLGLYFREPDMAGLERYIKTRCYDFDEVEKSVMEGTHPNILQRALDEVAAKASDDHSPENCVEDRRWQYFVTLPETPTQEIAYIQCAETSCSAHLSLKDRNVEIMASRHNSVYDYMQNFGSSEVGEKLFAEAKVAGKEVYAFPQPRLDELFTDLPKWHEKVEPTRNLLDSFVME